MLTSRSTTADPASAGAQVLRIVREYDSLESQGATKPVAIGALRSRGCYDDRFIDALARVIGAGRASPVVHEVELTGLEVGTTLADDAVTVDGNLLVARGQPVTDQLLERLLNLGPGAVRQPLHVVPAGSGGDRSTSIAADRRPKRKRILFVDDDRQLLDGLRDAFRSYRRQWDMSFVEGSDEAVDVIETQAQDAIVSDLRMPGTDGAKLLELVKQRWPGTIRMVLSGHADMALVARAAAVAHRMIAKPCDARELGRVIEQACSIQDMMRQVDLGRRTLGASALPSVPCVYAELTEVLESGSAGASDAARVIERDIALSAKVLQLAELGVLRSPHPGQHDLRRRCLSGR